MPCKILVSYQSALPTGEIVTLVPDNHTLSAKESLQENGGDKRTWTFLFTVIKITDKSLEELAFLNDAYIVAGEPTSDFKKRSYFRTPIAGTDPEYDILNTQGEIECTWSVAEPFIMERNNATS